MISLAREGEEGSSLVMAARRRSRSEAGEGEVCWEEEEVVVVGGEVGVEVGAREEEEEGERVVLVEEEEGSDLRRLRASLT